jgi:organic radical activating enzyme
MLDSQGQLPLDEKKNPYIEAFWIWLPEIYTGLEHLRITGGEPLLSEHCFKVLKMASEVANRNLVLSVNTNLSVSSDRLLKLAASVKACSNNIKEFTLFTSLDTWGPAAEYIRTGLNCDTFEKNLKFLFKEVPGLQVTVMCTFNALSLNSFDKMLKKVIEWKKFANQSGGSLSLDISYLKDPGFLSVLILPKSWQMKFNNILDQITKSSGFSELEISKFERLVEYFEKSERCSSRKISNFISFIEISDNRKKTSFRETFPEYSEFIQECREIRDAYRRETSAEQT